MDCLAEDMALTAADKTWISESIKNAISAHDPIGWRKAGQNIIAIGSPIALIGVILTLAIFAATQWSAANRRLADEARFEEKTGQRLDKIEEILRGLRVSRSAETPNNPASQAEAKIVIAEAKGGLPLAGSVVQEAGTEFINASSSDPRAWSVALDFASYRTVLNQRLSPPRSTLQEYKPTEGHGMYDVPSLDNKPGPAPFAQGVADPNVSARMEPLDTHLPQGDRGNAHFILVGGVTTIDGMRLRHVILENVEVHYSGRVVELDDVVFINCTFVIDSNTNGRLLAKSILSADQITLAVRDF